MKIAICGTGSGVARAPFGSDWELWGLSGHWNLDKKFNRIYELHTPKDLTDAGMLSNHVDWMLKNLTHIHPRLKKCFPDAQEFDFEKYIEKHGKYFTSSISWMLAEAIEQKPKEIGLWGVTMSANSEYGHQKPAATYLIGWAKALGIKVTIDKDSELLSSPFLYGYEEFPQFLKSMGDRKKRIEGILSSAENDVFEAKAKYHFAEGCMETIKDFENNFWSGTKC